MKLKHLLLLVPAVLLLSAEAEHEWPELSVSAEDARLEMLGMNSTGPGDAAPAIAPYLTGDADLLKTDLWKEVKSADILSAGNKAEDKVVDEALKEFADEIEALVKASRKKEFHFWGEQIKVDRDKDITAQPYPEYANFLFLSRLTVVQSRRLDRKGRHDAARERLLAVGRIGDHFCGEPYLLGYMIGTVLKETAATHLAELENRHGRKDAAAKWLLYRDLLASRKKSWKKFTTFAINSPDKQVKKLLLNEDIPFSFRMETLIWNHYCVEGGLDFNLGTLKCIVTDTPDWVLEVEDELSRRDPVYNGCSLPWFEISH